MSKNVLEKRAVCGLIVTYNPDDGFEARVELINGQVDRVIVVDNNSDKLTVERLERLFADNKIHLIRNTYNAGIATALNQGTNKASEFGYEWVLLFDHDTIPLDNMLDEFVRIYSEYPYKDRLGVIGSNYIDINTNKKENDYPEYASKSWLEVKEVITSGSLVALDAFRRVGGFREEFFIDFVDFDYCLKLRKKGYKIVTTVRPVMVHSLGNSTLHRFLGKNIVTTNHPPWRRYYMVRNSIILCREYVFYDLLWVVRRIRTIFEWFFYIILFEESKKDKLKNMLKGLLDGVFN